MGSETSSQKLVEFTEQNFEQEVLQSDVPVLVDLWAEWCMPCKMVHPVVEELAHEYEGRVKVGQLDVDSNRQLAIQYNITAIPTLMLFHNGKLVRKLIGVQPKNNLKTMIDETLG